MLCISYELLKKTSMFSSTLNIKKIKKQKNKKTKKKDKIT
jgi:hypothetical protein